MGVIFFLSRESPRSVVANVLDYIVVNGFDILSRYNVHFLTNTLGKGVVPFVSPLCYRLNSNITVFLERL